MPTWTQIPAKSQICEMVSVCCWNYYIFNQKPTSQLELFYAGICKTLIATICFWLASGFSNAASYEEHALKAAFLYNFAAFINWPAFANNEPSTVLNYCVFKDGLIQSSLKSLINSDLDPKIERKFQLLTDLNKIGRCHLLYLDASDLTTNPNLLAVTSGFPILTASDKERFLERGGGGCRTIQRFSTRHDPNGYSNAWHGRNRSDFESQGAGATDCWRSSSSNYSADC